MSWSRKGGRSSTDAAMVIRSPRSRRLSGSHPSRSCRSMRRNAVASRGAGGRGCVGTPSSASRCAHRERGEPAAEPVVLGRLRQCAQRDAEPTTVRGKGSLQPTQNGRADPGRQDAGESRRAGVAVLGVAGEQLVAALAGQDDLHVAAGRLGQPEDRDVRRLGQWSPAQGRQRPPQVREVLRPDLDGVVGGAQAGRHESCERGLVVPRVAELGAVRVDAGMSADLGDLGRHQARVDAAGEVGAHGHVREQGAVDRPAEAGRRGGRPPPRDAGPRRAAATVSSTTTRRSGRRWTPRADARGVPCGPPRAGCTARAPTGRPGRTPARSRRSRGSARSPPAAS